VNRRSDGREAGDDADMASPCLTLSHHSLSAPGAFKDDRLWFGVSTGSILCPRTVALAIMRQRLDIHLEQ
jgi:hypothetical protein